MGVTWPVAIDNDWQTRKAYNNRFWPAMYLVDKQGTTFSILWCPNRRYSCQNKAIPTRSITKQTRVSPQPMRKKSPKV